MGSDVIPAIVADIEETRWRERGAKRKQQRDTSFVRKGCWIHTRLLPGSKTSMV